MEDGAHVTVQGSALQSLKSLALQDVSNYLILGNTTSI